MRVFFDTEFFENGSTIELISIGLKREDGEELYLIADFDEKRVRRDSEWVSQNVLKYIPPATQYPRYPQLHIGQLILNFLHDIPKPEFWAYYCAYDWVALAQCYGRMIDLPENFPKWCRDLQQLATDLNVQLPVQTGVEHHALADARWVKDSFDFCEQQRKGVVS